MTMSLFSVCDLHFCNSMFNCRQMSRRKGAGIGEDTGGNPNVAQTPFFMVDMTLVIPNIVSTNVCVQNNPTI